MIPNIDTWFRAPVKTNIDEPLDESSTIVYVMNENEYRISNKDCLRITMVLSHCPDQLRYDIEPREELYITIKQYDALPENLRRFFKPHRVKIVNE
jgi:hypothetical protein